MSRTAHVYIDGFNLYYGSLKANPALKWLDLEGLGAALTPQDYSLGHVYYFTARVNGVTDPGAPLRQDKFLKAVGSSPLVDVVEGNFKTRKGSYPLAADTSRFATIVRTEEKGSDVNLASYMLRDAHLSACQAAVVVSDDFDLLSPLHRAREDAGALACVCWPSDARSALLHAVQYALRSL